MYGLNTVKPLVFGLPAGFSLIAGTTRLVESVIAPEGLLLKSVSSIEEAAACGGVMLYSAASGRYLIYQGVLLHKALSLDLLGKVAPWALDRDQVKTAISLIPLAYHEYVWRAESTDGDRAWTKTNFGGEVVFNRRLVNYFPDSEELTVLGVVCSATTGMITSHPTDIPPSTIASHLGTGNPAALGFVSTYVDLPESMTQVLQRIYSKIIPTVPAELRSFYSSVFADAVSTFPFRNTVPSIAISTYWRNGRLWTGRHYKPKIAPSGETDPLGLSGGIAGDGWPKLSENGFIYPNEPASVTVNPGRLVLGHLPGAYSSANVIFPNLTDQDFSCEPGDALSVPTGVCAGLKVGLLRDGHVLARSYVGGATLFQDTPSVFADLAALVNDAVVEMDVPYASAHPQATIDNMPELEGRASLGATSTYSMELSIFTPGTLPLLLQQFSKHWDTLAWQEAKG